MQYEFSAMVVYWCRIGILVFNFDLMSLGSADSLTWSGSIAQVTSSSKELACASWPAGTVKFIFSISGDLVCLGGRSGARAERPCMRGAVASGVFNRDCWIFSTRACARDTVLWEAWLSSLVSGKGTVMLRNVSCNGTTLRTFFGVIEDGCRLRSLALLSAESNFFVLSSAGELPHHPKNPKHINNKINSCVCKCNKAKTGYMPMTTNKTKRQKQKQT